jgi:hypothetical protein
MPRLTCLMSIAGVEVEIKQRYQFKAQHDVRPAHYI